MGHDGKSVEAMSRCRVDDVRLEPGQSMTTSICLRAPEALGTHSVAIYFYYEVPTSSSTSRFHHYRMLKLNFVIKVAALVNVNAIRNRPCLHDNNLCQTIVVAVSNASTAVHTQHQVRHFTSELLPQFYLISIIYSRV